MRRCKLKPDYRNACGEPAEYIVYGQPCSCTDIFGHDACSGHPVCVRHAAELRGNRPAIWPRSDVRFTVTRMHSLLAAHVGGEQ